jgi:KDO2-lipid IV(A) lauroyltransferase
MSARPAAPWYYRLLTWPLLALAHLPLVVLHGLAGLLYLLLRYVVRYRWGVVIENLRKSFPEKNAAEVERIGHQFYWHFAQVVVEILKLAAISPTELQRRMRKPDGALAGLAPRQLGMDTLRRGAAIPGPGGGRVQAADQ